MNWPLMFNNITRDDLNKVVEFLNQDPPPILTNHNRVRQFESEWGTWLGSPHNVMVNSGSAANELTMLALKQVFPRGSEIIVPPITWVSDIAAVLHNGFIPVFCDISLTTLALDEELIEQCITPKTRAIFLTHVLGYNGLTQKIVDLCKKYDIMLIEDVCESHGATFNGVKVGTIGEISNFSYYYAHHMTCIEGGMISTRRPDIYELCRMLRSHGMVREADNATLKQTIIDNNPTLNKDFIFIEAAHNFRSTEINAVMASNQLKRLDANNIKRSEHLHRFISQLDESKYITGFNLAGNSNYALTPILRYSDMQKRNAVESCLKANGIEFRRGLSGGGSQIRQPYIKQYMTLNPEDYPVAEHCHNFGWYIGNYPELESSNIDQLVTLLNSI